MVWWLILCERRSGRLLRRLILKDAQQREFIPGITLRSVCACLLAMVLMGIHIHVVEVVLNDGTAAAEQSLPLSALIVLVGLVIVCGLLRVAAKFSLLTRQEMLCVLFSMLISAPMMTQGMWHRFLGLISSPPRTSSFNYLDAYSDDLWPHGPNLVEGKLQESNLVEGPVEETGEVVLIARGNPPAWSEIEYNEGRKAALPVLQNSRPEDVSSLTLVIPVTVDGRAYVNCGEPHLVTCLFHPQDLTPQSSYFIRVYADDDEKYEEVLKSREAGEKTFIQRKGFLRAGHYGTIMPPDAEKYVRVQIGLSGVGEVALCDPKVFSVAALEGAYKGQAVIRRSEYEKLQNENKDLPREKRTDLANLIVKPDKMWSLAGLRFLVAGYIPVKDWVRTAVAWATPIFLLLLGTLLINVLMRKQWAERERYPFPLFQIPRAIIGQEDEPPEQGFARVWRSRFLWAGFALAIVWGGLRGWNFYNPKVPNPGIEVQLSQYLSDPNWGAMWQVTFLVSIIVLSICMFFELNVLVSLVIGFFAFRALHWLGESSGWKVYSLYPFRYEQAVGAYLGYALVVVFLARKYLKSVVVSAFRDNRRASQGEAISYRTALLLLAAVFVAFSIWAAWLGVSIVAILIFFAFLLTIGLVASKFRAECGLPTGYFTPYNAMLFIALIGGMNLFGASGMLFCLIASGFLTVSVFFFIPGAQMELLEYGRRYRVVPRHLVYTAIIGALGGLFIGGWVFLSNSYSVGGETIRYQWAFNQDWFFTAYKMQLARANTELIQGGAAAGGITPSTYGYLYGGVITVVLTVLRQAFSGFWFHPIGFILGSAHMLEWTWGSVLVACVIRFVVLKLGGAATVRNKLMPFCVGMFLGGLLVMFAFNIIAVYLRANGVERIFGKLI